MKAIAIVFGIIAAIMLIAAATSPLWVDKYVDKGIVDLSGEGKE